jgi:hypothetical protein
MKNLIKGTLTILLNQLVIAFICWTIYDAFDLESIFKVKITYFQWFGLGIISHSIIPTTNNLFPDNKDDKQGA